VATLRAGGTGRGLRITEFTVGLLLLQGAENIYGTVINLPLVFKNRPAFGKVRAKNIAAPVCRTPCIMSPMYADVNHVAHVSLISK